MSEKKSSQFKISYDEETKEKNADALYTNKMKSKILPNNLVDKRFAIDEELLEEDDDDEKIAPLSPLSESFIFINKENLGEGSSRTIKLIDDLEEKLRELEKKGLKNEKFLKRITELMQVLRIMQNQYNMIKEILDSSSDSIALIRKKYQFLSEYFININSKNDICFTVLEISANYIMNNVLMELCSIIEILLTKFSQKRSLRYLNDLKIIHSKLKTVVHIFPNAVTFSKGDIFSYEKNHPMWKEIDKIIERRVLGDPQKMAKNFKRIVRYILLGNAIISKESEQKNVITQKIAMGFGAIYYFFLTKKAQKKAKVFISDPNSKTTKKIWNLPDSTLMKGVMEIMMPSIEYNKKIYIERNIVRNIKLKEDGQNLEEFELSEADFHKIEDLNEYCKTIFSKPPKKSKDKISIRVLSSRKLTTNKNIQSKKKNFFLNFWKHSKKEKKNQFCDTVIIHIHGGGFISTSSRNHQIYTRKWANNLKLPIFAIDYRLAPEHPYPEALDDCWQAYNWIIQYSYYLFDIEPKNVILVGDSAGGNLVCALTIKLINSKGRIPDGLVLAYPALDLRSDRFTPSFLLSLDDQIMPHTFIRLSIDSYLGNNLKLRPESDPYISPLIADDEILNKFPPTRILVGTKDPLHDESIRFGQRLNKLKKDIRIMIYDEMPHGFLNYDSPKGIPEAKICVNEAMDCIRELIYLKEMKEDKI